MEERGSARPERLLDARLFGARRKEAPRCPACGTPLCDGARQYLDARGAPVGCDACVTVRWR